MQTTDMGAPRSAAWNHFADELAKLLDFAGTQPRPAEALAELGNVTTHFLGTMLPYIVALSSGYTLEQAVRDVVRLLLSCVEQADASLAEEER